MLYMEFSENNSTLVKSGFVIFCYGLIDTSRFGEISLYILIS